jgi:flagellar FliJ protein
VKRFVFRFQRVLDTRRHFEDVKKNELAALMAQRLEDEQRLLATQAELLDGQLALARRAEAREMLPGLAQWAAYFSRLTDDIERFAHALSRWDEQIEVKRAELVEAKRDVKVLEKLEDTDRGAFDKTVARWEQKRIDEVATGRFIRGVREGVQR